MPPMPRPIRKTSPQEKKMEEVAPRKVVPQPKPVKKLPRSDRETRDISQMLKKQAVREARRAARIAPTPDAKDTPVKSKPVVVQEPAEMEAGVQHDLKLLVKATSRSGAPKEMPAASTEVKTVPTIVETEEGVSKSKVVELKVLVKE